MADKKVTPHERNLLRGEFKFNPDLKELMTQETVLLKGTSSVIGRFWYTWGNIRCTSTSDDPYSGDWRWGIYSNDDLEKAGAFIERLAIRTQRIREYTELHAVLRKHPPLEEGEFKNAYQHDLTLGVFYELRSELDEVRELVTERFYAVRKEHFSESNEQK